MRMRDILFQSSKATQSKNGDVPNSNAFSVTSSMKYYFLRIQYQIIFIDDNVISGKKTTKINKTIQQGLCVLFNNTIGIIKF